MVNNMLNTQSQETRIIFYPTIMKSSNARLQTNTYSTSTSRFLSFHLRSLNIIQKNKLYIIRDLEVYTYKYIYIS